MHNRRELLADGAAFVAAGVTARESAAAPVGQPMVNTESPPGLSFPASRSAHGWTVPRPMFWSFEDSNPVVDVAGLRVSFNVVTIGPIEASFALDRDALKVRDEGGRQVVEARSFAWPGQREKAPGTLRAEFVNEGKVTTVRIEATAMETIRAIKMTLHDLPMGRFYHTGWQVVENGAPVDTFGVTSNYPVYTGGMPVWLLGDATRGMSFASVDLTAMPRRCAARARNGKVEIELIAEADGRALGTHIAPPPWRITSDTSLARAIDERCAMLEQGAGLKRWETRDDMPAWARDIDLVVTLHGMHWSGYIFNGFKRMGEAVEWVTRRIEGRRVLFFLAAWDGRYYRSYGASRAEPAMGGADGLDRLVRLIHAKGSHVMAMFAGNVVDERIPGADKYLAASEYRSLPDGIDSSPMRGYTVDWAQVRAPLTGLHWLNLGAPAWRDHLTQQIAQLNERHGFDGTFIDTQPIIGNDRLHDSLAGFRYLADALRTKKTDLLMASETWIDLSLPFMPMSQTPGGPFDWCDRYQRRFAHLSLGEPSRGSTGVHEVGYVPYDRADLLRTFTLPTVAFVERTWEETPQAVEAIIAAAKVRHR